jgi:predicted metal-dependent hydrolase/CheY-like chemotaxis protein
VLLAMTEDLAFVMHLEDVGRELGFSVVALSSPDELGEEEEAEARPVPLTEPLVGQDATLVRRLVELQPALILVDLSHARMPWERWIQTLKTSAATRRFPVLAFGPHIDKQAFARAESAGADRVISRGEISARLATILQESARRVDDMALEASCSLPLSDGAVEGLALLESGRYFEAHEVLERAWMGEPGVEGFLYRALVQVAVAYLHIARNNYRGAVKMLLRIHNWLDPLPTVCRGIDVLALRRNVQALRDRLDELGPEGLPSLDPRLLAPVPMTSPPREEPGT